MKNKLLLLWAVIPLCLNTVAYDNNADEMFERHVNEYGKCLDQRFDKAEFVGQNEEKIKACLGKYIEHLQSEQSMRNAKDLRLEQDLKELSEGFVKFKKIRCQAERNPVFFQQPYEFYWWLLAAFVECHLKLDIRRSKENIIENDYLSRLTCNHINDAKDVIDSINSHPARPYMHREWTFKTYRVTTDPSKDERIYPIYPKSVWSKLFSDQ